MNYIIYQYCDLGCIKAPAFARDKVLKATCTTETASSWRMWTRIPARKTGKVGSERNSESSDERLVRDDIDFLSKPLGTKDKSLLYKKRVINGFVATAMRRRVIALQEVFKRPSGVVSQKQCES